MKSNVMIDALVLSHFVKSLRFIHDLNKILSLKKL